MRNNNLPKKEQTIKVLSSESANGEAKPEKGDKRREERHCHASHHSPEYPMLERFKNRAF